MPRPVRAFIRYQRPSQEFSTTARRENRYNRGWPVKPCIKARPGSRPRRAAAAGGLGSGCGSREKEGTNLQHAFKLPCIDIGLNMVAGQVGDAGPGYGSHPGERNVVDDQLPVDADVERAAVLLELLHVYAAVRREPEFDAIVPREVVGSAGRSPPRKVVRRADGSHSSLGADAHRDHALRDCLARADAGVEPFGGDVHEAGVDADLHVQVRMLPQNCRDRGRQDRLGRVVARGNPDRTDGFVPKLP